MELRLQGPGACLTPDQTLSTKSWATGKEAGEEMLAQQTESQGQRRVTSDATGAVCTSINNSTVALTGLHQMGTLTAGSGIWAN